MANSRYTETLGSNIRSVISTTTSGPIALGAPTISNSSIIVGNEGGQAVWIKFGNSGVSAATVADMHVLAGQSRVFSVSDTVTHFQAISVGAGATINVAKCNFN